jgi:hypothetical protein
MMKATYQLLKGKEKLVLGRNNILLRINDRHVIEGSISRIEKF